MILWPCKCERASCKTLEYCHSLANESRSASTSKKSRCAGVQRNMGRRSLGTHRFLSAQATLDAKVSRKVLSMARDQQDELAREELDSVVDGEGLP